MSDARTAILLLSGVAALWLEGAVWAAVGILIIVVAAFISALVIVRRHRRAQRAAREARRAWQQRRDPRPVDLFVDEAATIVWGHRSPSEGADEVLRRLRLVEPDFTLETIEGNPDVVIWRINLKPGPELGPFPWPKENEDRSKE